MAVGLLEWSAADVNKPQLCAFIKRLFTALQKPLISFSRRSFNREILWRNYFLVRSSEEFISNWVAFLKDADLTPTPIFYQHLTDLVFRHLIDNHLIGFTDDITPAAALMDHEAGVLRYAAGYVCRHLRRKIERGNHKLKEELVLCLMALVRSGNDEECGPDEEWTRMLDRGGLWYVKETTYSLFLVIEEEARQCLKTLSSQHAKCKKEIIADVTSNDDVLFYWIIATADFEIDDEEVHEMLLKMIVELYITIRGFSYASGWMEKYKQYSKQSTQRSKSLRRDLYEGSSTL